MAYTKQTWTDDVSAVTGTRMTHIEQGIYNNSLATDKINPSGTATTTAEIEEGQVNDVIGFKSLKLKGQTSQYTTTGNNLLIPFATTTQSSNGITRTTNSDGSVTLSGTATANSYLRITENITLESNTAYTTLNQNANLPNGVTIYYNDVSNIGVAYNDTAIIPNARVKSYTTGTVTGAITIAILIQSGTSFSTPVTLYPMLVKGTITTSNIPSYEKYTGGKASPNPDFPQDVNNVSGYNVVGISNKNLLELKQLTTETINGVTFTPHYTGNKLDYINVNGTASATASYNLQEADVNHAETFPNELPSGTYILSDFSGSTTADRAIYFRYTVDGSTYSALNSVANTRKFTVNKKFKYASYIRIASGQNVNNVKFYPQLEKGTSATTYIAHQGNNFSIDLPVENLLNLTDGTYTNNGIEAVVRDGVITLNGTAGANNSYINIPYSQTIEPKIEYTLSLNNDFTTSNTSDGLRLSTNDDTRGSFTALNRTKTFTFQNALASNQITLRLMAGSTVKNGKMKPQLEKGSITHAYTPYGTNPIELCKISTYEDYIYKKDGKWFVHKEFEKLTLKDMNWFLADNTGLSNTVSHRWAINHPCSRITNNNMQVTMSNILPMGSANITWGQDVLSIGQSVSQVVIRMPAQYTTVEAMKTALAELNAVGYALLGTPIDEEITYTPLIRQLDELYNSGLYDVTNISQDNSSEAFILDFEACKNNINGIVEYIRR